MSPEHTEQLLWPAILFQGFLVSVSCVLGLEVSCHAHTTFRFWGPELRSLQFYLLSLLPSLHVQKLYTMVLFPWVTAEWHLMGGGQVDSLVWFCSVLCEEQGPPTTHNHKPWAPRGAKGRQFTLQLCQVRRLRVGNGSYKPNTRLVSPSPPPHLISHGLD